MRERNLRYRLTTGSFTLPAASMIVAVLWLLSGTSDYALWGGLAVVAVMVYLFAEMNTRYSLLRVRSRMVATAFLLFCAASPFFSGFSLSALPAVSLLAAFFPLFSSYQQPKASGLIFHSGLALGLGSLAYPPMVCLLVPVMLVMAVQLRSLSWRTFSALFLGMVLPYWFAVAYGVWTGSLEELYARFVVAFQMLPPDYETLSLPMVLSAGYLVLVGSVGAIHFLRTAYNDKIRTRMLFYALIFLFFIFVGFLAVQPQDADVALRLVMVVAAPIVAHHFTLSSGRMANLWFIFCLIVWMALVLFNVLFVHGVVG